LYELFQNFWFVLIVGIAAIGALLLIVSYLCRRFKEKLDKKIIITGTFTIIVVLLIQNIVGIVLFATQQRSDNMFYKETFAVDIELEEQANIYWIHTDGMLGFDSMYRFFGDEQEEFTRELEIRGFRISSEAALEARRYTQWALPALMNPFYYDRVQSWQLHREYAQALPMNYDLLKNPGLRKTANFSSNRIARERNEIVMAFNAAGYNTSTIAYIGMYLYPTVQQFYNGGTLMVTTRSLDEIITHVNNVSAFRELVDLMSMLSPLHISRSSAFSQIFRDLTALGFESVDVEAKVDLFSDIEINKTSRGRLKAWNRHADSLYDVLNRPSPRFVILNFSMPHRPFDFDEYGSYNGEGAENPMRYPGHHKFCAYILLKYVDLILEHDPDAVIVLQADHGLHGVKQMGGTEELMKVFSCTEEEIQALWNGVMSAVRLPGEAMTPEKEKILSDPRNISRYLVNNYVGQNYNYIPYEYRQIFKGPER